MRRLDYCGNMMLNEHLRTSLLSSYIVIGILTPNKACTILHQIRHNANKRMLMKMKLQNASSHRYSYHRPGILNFNCNWFHEYLIMSSEAGSWCRLWPWRCFGRPKTRTITTQRTKSSRTTPPSSRCDAAHTQQSLVQ